MTPKGVSKDGVPKRLAKLVEPYLVTDGSKFRLKDVDPRDSGGLGSEDKPEAKELLTAYAAGMEVAMLGDIRLAAEGTVFGAPEVQIGVAIDGVMLPVLVIAGFATEAVVFHAALSALENGYQVQVPADACGGLSSRTEDAALRQIEAAGGVTTSVVTLVTAMAPDFEKEPGRSAFVALQALRLA